MISFWWIQKIIIIKDMILLIWHWYNEYACIYLQLTSLKKSVKTKNYYKIILYIWKLWNNKTKIKLFKHF